MRQRCLAILHHPIKPSPMKTNHRLNVWHILFLLLLMAGTVWMIRRNAASADWQAHEGSIFGTYYRITYASPESFEEEVLRELQAVDASLSMFNENSTVARINRGETAKADERLVEVFRLAQEVSAATDGAFDVTVAPLVNAWGFGYKNRTAVTPEMVDSMLEFVGWQKVTLASSGNIQKSDPRLMMDFSAIAKGYGVDCAARVLERHGVEDYCVDIGGEMRVKGHNAKGNIWTIGIQHPQKPAEGGVQNSLMAVRLTDCGLATSGNYNRYYIRNGKRISHTIDPKTGQPAGHTLLSATVRAKDCATADALATAFMSMGSAAAIRYLDAHADVSACLISADSLGQPQVVLRGKWDVAGK